MDNVTSRLSSIKKNLENIAFSSNLTVAPTLIAVSKFQPFSSLLEAYRAGQRDFGENYAQELIEKARAFQAEGIHDSKFHFIGHLQSNKVKALLPYVDSIHSVDSLKLLKEIHAQAVKLQLKPKIYFQINIDEEESKSGFLVHELEALVNELPNYPSVNLMGLMCIPDPNASSESSFKKIKALSERYSKIMGQGLSMGMSHDYEAAIRLGSTAVRIGTAIFGARK